MSDGRERGISLAQRVLGNVVEVPRETVEAKIKPLLIENEAIIAGYMAVRDLVVVTNRRLIVQDVQGITGKKQTTHSIPWPAVNTFSIETPGPMDLNAHLTISIKGEGTKSIPFAKTSLPAVQSLQRKIARRVLK